jgi:hypothetical protein
MNRPGVSAILNAVYDSLAIVKDWGYAALVEINGKRILFDTGDDAAILSKNVKATRVDLSKLDFVVHYLYAGLGTTLNLGANPRAASDRRATGVLDEGDLHTYRTLLTLSDDLRNGGPEIVHLAQTK